MTNSYNLSQPKKLPKLIIIHGLNNNLQSFIPLKNEFEKMGYQCHSLTLPGHGKDRTESRDFKTAFRYFDQEIKKLTQDPYVVIAFSQGALYFQLWLEKNQGPKPLAQVLLAPALYINRYLLTEKIMRTLPSFALIPSAAPRKIRRYPALYVREYRTLLDGIKTYQALKGPIKVPTYILIDPKDELVDAETLKRELFSRGSVDLKVDFEERNHLKNNRGHHHILFHPDYFKEEQWRALCVKAECFLGKYT